MKHLQMAKELTHPFSIEPELPEDMRLSIEEIAASHSSPMALVHRRIQVVQPIEEKGAELEGQRAQLAASSSYCFQKMESPLHVPLMEYAQALTGTEDDFLPRKLLLGLPIVGPADESPFFDPYIVPARITLAQLLEGIPQRRAKIVESMTKAAKRRPRDS